MNYFFKIGVSLSMLLGAVFGARTYETVCTKAWRQRNSTIWVVRIWAHATIRLTNIFEADHCLKSWRWHQAIYKAILMKKGLSEARGKR